jgi:hypothetical protein
MKELQPYATSRPVFQRINGFLTLWTCLWVGMVSIFDWTIFPVAFAEMRTFVFLPVEASVLSCEIVASTGDDGGPQRRRHLRYIYQAEGQSLEGFRFYPTPRTVERVDRPGDCTGFAKGNALTAYVSPSNRTEAMLRKGLQPSTLQMLMFMTPFNLIGLAMLRWGAITWRGLRKGELLRNAFLDRNAHSGWRLKRIDMTVADAVALGLGVSTFFASFAVFGLQYFGTQFPVESMLWAVCATIAAAGGWYWHKRLQSGCYDWIYDCRRCTLAKADGSIKVYCAEIDAILLVHRIERDSDGDQNFGASIQLHLKHGATHEVFDVGSHLKPERARTDGEFLLAWLVRELSPCCEVRSVAIEAEPDSSRNTRR